MDFFKNAFKFLSPLGEVLKRFAPSGSIEFLGIRVEIRDTPKAQKGWLPMSAGDGPQDRLWSDVLMEQQDALEAWARNFVIRQVVRLTTAFVVGDGIEVSSKKPKVQKWLAAFWSDNQMDSRLPAWSDELVRSGELFPILFSDTGPVREADESGQQQNIVANGAQFVRVLPASIIGRVKTADEDYETELEYHEIVPGSLEPRVWQGWAQAKAQDPVVLHYTVNKPIGATRGLGDLLPVLPWAKRYTEWLKDRVILNKLRIEMAAMVVKAKDAAKMQAFFEANPAHYPKNGNVTIVGQDDSVEATSLNIRASDSKDDGQALRLAIAAGSGYPLHFFAEGENSNRATASEMGDPTHRFLRMRQQEIIAMVTDLVTKAYQRASELRKSSSLPSLPSYGGDLELEVSAPDISRADNKALADAGKVVVEMFATMKNKGWITDELAIRLAFKFLGEILEESEIKEILDIENAPTPTEEQIQDISDGELQAALDAGNALAIGTIGGANGKT